MVDGTLSNVSIYYWSLIFPAVGSKEIEFVLPSIGSCCQPAAIVRKIDLVDHIEPGKSDRYAVIAAKAVYPQYASSISRGKSVSIVRIVQTPNGSSAVTHIRMLCNIRQIAENVDRHAIGAPYSSEHAAARRK